MVVVVGGGFPHALAQQQQSLASKLHVRRVQRCWVTCQSPPTICNVADLPLLGGGGEGGGGGGGGGGYRVGCDVEGEGGGVQMPFAQQ